MVQAGQSQTELLLARFIRAMIDRGAIGKERHELSRSAFVAGIEIRLELIDVTASDGLSIVTRRIAKSEPAS